jgi:hypothetical protein
MQTFSRKVLDCAADGGRGRGMCRRETRQVRAQARRAAQPLRNRAWDTCAGLVDLEITRLRKRRHFPSFWSHGRE